MIYLFVTVAMMATVSACSNSASNKNVESNVNEAEIEAEIDNAHAMLAIKGSCEMCKKRIEKAAKDVEGVTFAEWHLEGQEMHLHFDTNKTSLKAVSEAIAKIGYDTELDKAPDEAYNALPDCCKYRND
jgi:Cu(I)/Ag(I) efflux system membrane fusion protein